MKQINTYINEKLRLTTKRTYACQPKDEYELRKIIVARIEDEGPTCDLNDIDISKVTNMYALFDVDANKIFTDFNGDISMWDVSNVWDIAWMFHNCKKFNCDISKWNVSNVRYINNMFDGCKNFNQDLNSWDVSKVKNMWKAFYKCPTTPIWYDRTLYDK